VSAYNLDRTQQAQHPTASLEVSMNNGLTTRHKLTRPVTSAGRDKSNDICIDAPVISAFHFQIVYDGDQYMLIHPHPARQETTNGLLYQNRHINGKESFRQILGHGDTFRIGNEKGIQVTCTFDEGRAASGEFLPHVRPILLNKPRITIGRLPQNDVTLDHPQVSAQHAQLELQGQLHYIVDLNSTNHTYVNGRRVTRTALKPDDKIRIGPFLFSYHGTQLTQYTESPVIRIDALGLKKEAHRDGKQQVLLNNISLAIPARKFVALVGASGAGKSTLMDALNGLRPAQQGTVLYDGQDYYASFEAFRSQLGYVPQDDIIHRDLTVERALYYAAQLRLPEDFPEEQIRRRIDEVLGDVDMKQRRNLLISKLSGGQRKRVSIALELLSKPSVFFLDEPTSGLDPGLDRKMMRLLRTLASKGQTIVLVTHATNNITACDYVCFLAEGGRMVYFGPPNEAKKFFGTDDFADIYILLDSSHDPTAPAREEQRFLHSSDYGKYVATALKQVSRGTQSYEKLRTPPRGNPWRQFAILSRRYVELLVNDWRNLLILGLQAPIIALILILFIQFGIGSGGFDPTNIVQCPTTAQIFTPSGFPAVPDPDHPIMSKSCSSLQHFLSTDPQGKAYAAKRGGTLAALQDFLLPGPGDAPKILFIMAFAAIMFGCINAAREIVKELPIYRRERMVSIGIIPYMCSKIVVLGTLCLLQCAILVLAVSIVDPFQQSIFLPGLLEIYITLVLTSLAGLMMGLTVSAFVANNDRAMSFVPILLIPQVIFSGTLFSLKGWFLQILGSLFAVRWAMAALGSSVGLHSDKLGGDKLFGDIYTYQGTLFSTNSQSTATSYLLFTWFALGILIALFAYATAYLLKSKDRRE